MLEPVRRGDAARAVDEDGARRLAGRGAGKARLQAALLIEVGERGFPGLPAAEADREAAARALGGGKLRRRGAVVHPARRARRAARRARYRRDPSPRPPGPARARSRNTARRAGWPCRRASRKSAMIRPISLMMLGWMPSVGSSSTSSRGCMTSARAIASCCCWPPERSPPRRPSIVLRIGKERRKYRRGGGATRRLQDGEPGLEILAHGEQGEDIAALRHPGDAAARALVGGQAGDLRALPADAAGGDRVGTDDGAQQARLADAVAPEEAGDLVRPRR